MKYFLEYASQFLGNCGNYKGFGDSKFVPRCEEKVFAALAATSPKGEKFYKETKGAIFSSNNEGLMHLGFLDDGHMTTYYPDSKGITKEDIGAVSKWMEKKKLLPVYFNSSTGEESSWLISSRKTPGSERPRRASSSFLLHQQSLQSHPLVVILAKRRNSYLRAVH